MARPLNINSYSHISYGHGLTGLKSSINYLVKGSSHNSKVPKRALEIRATNCSTNPKITYQEIKKTLNRSYINPKSISVIRDIETFHGVNWKIPSQRKEAQNINKDLIKNLESKYGNMQVFSVYQADTKKQVYHVHNIFCARTFDTLKSTSHKMRWWNIAHEQDKVLRSHGFKPTNNGQLHHHRKRAIIQLEKKINQALRHSRNIWQYKEYLQKENINIKLFKTIKINGKRKIKTYNKKSKNGYYIKLPNNKFIRLRKHFKYSFNYLGNKIVIRDKKLNHKCQSNQIINNLSKLNQIKLYNNFHNYINNNYNHKNTYKHPKIKLSSKHLINTKQIKKEDNYYKNKENQIINKEKSDSKIESNKYKRLEELENIDIDIEILKLRIKLIKEIKINKLHNKNTYKLN